MQNYEVGDTVEATDINGRVEDTGVVTRIEKEFDYDKVWCLWENDDGELHFPSTSELFRIKTKRPSGEITKEMVTKVIEVMVNQIGVYMQINHVPTTSDFIYSIIAEEQKKQQQKNDPEYQKYLELKKKFES
jgi:hypothetical protein